MMEWSSLELKLISCRDLKAFNFYQKLSVYAVVSIINDELKKKEQQQQTQKTPIDREGGRNPEWNHIMQFDLKALPLFDHSDHLFLRFDFRSEGIMFGKNSIGEVRVPIKDLIDEFNGAVRFISYQVRNSDGKPNGVLNFSYTVNGKTENSGSEPNGVLNFSYTVNRKNKKSGGDSPEIDSPSGIQFSSEKVHYPSVEVDHPSRDICYPSLDDVHSALPGTCFPSPKFDCQTPEIYGMTPPPLLPPHMVPPMVARGAYYHPYPPSSLVQMPGPYCYTLESTGHGSGSCGYPAGFGQLGRVDVDGSKVRRDGLQLPGSSTRSSGR